MLSFKKKLSENLKNSLNNNEFKYYRVLICYNNFPERVEKKILRFSGKIIHHINIINCFSAKATSYTIERLLECPEIDYILLDSYAILCGNKIQTSYQANGINLNINYRLTGKNIGIGIIDSGVYPHVDLTKPRNKIKNFTDLLNGFKHPYDDNGHGTFISGIISSNHVKDFSGIAEDSHIYMVKAFDKMGKGFVSTILKGIEILINESPNYNIRIICLPFEILENNSFILNLFHKIFDFAIEKNIIIVTPSGNNLNEECSIKGISVLDNCLTVGGIDTSSYTIKPYEFSSSGPYKKADKPNVVAACSNIRSLNCDTNFVSERNGLKLYPSRLKELYTVYSGTSCAAAYVTALCALLLENNNNLSFKDMLDLIKLSCDLLKFPKNMQGWGKINLDKLLP